MSVKLYFDEHVHGVLAMTLPQRGVDLLTVQQDLHDAKPDSVVFACAITLGRVLVSSDAHMLVIAANYIAQGRRFNGLLYMYRAPLRRHLESLEYIANEAEPHELFNKVLRLPL